MEWAIRIVVFGMRRVWQPGRMIGGSFAFILERMPLVMEKLEQAAAERDEAEAQNQGGKTSHAPFTMRFARGNVNVKLL